MKKHLLAAVAAFAIGAPARAAMNCGPARVDIGDPGAIGVVSTYVAHDPDGRWTIKHTLANGAVIDRSLQYLIADYIGPNALQWRGTLMRNANMTMVGEAMRLTATGQPTYNEWLYQNGKLIMHSVALCRFDAPPVTQPSASAPAALAYAPVEEPRPEPVSGPAPAATPAAVTVPPAAAPAVAAVSVGEDSIGILNLGKAVFAQLTVGSLLVTMQIDTGATDMTVSERVAQDLLAKGEAETTDDGQVILADGSRITEKRVIVHDVKIGTHELRNVVAGVVSNDAEMLLPFPVLNAIGIVTIDTTANKLIFNQPPKTVGVQATPVAATPPAARLGPTAAADVQAMPVADGPPVVAEPFAPAPAPKSEQFGVNAPPGPRERPTQVDPAPGGLY
jgi:gag-polyprotein putative aspartyl protease